jgi:putative peptidoglycan binding protein/glycosyl hydrolase family 25
VTTAARVTPFRAGARPGEAPRVLTGVPLTAAPSVLLADISEFQPDLADAAYLAWSKAIVIRAMYGDAHDDGAWYGGARRADLHAGGAAFLGIYQYVVATQDAATQARALATLLGQMEPGEKIIADMEEGAGPQLARWQAWAQVIRDELGDEPWSYSGLYFAQAAGLAPVTWLADYTSTEPAEPHTIWQFTDSYPVPGVGTADCSVYHGTIDSLAALGWQGQPAPAPQPTPPAPVPGWTEILMTELPELAQGAASEDVRSLQGLLVARRHAINVDGDFGPATRAALQAFQTGVGLPPDGICGQQTWVKLHNR